MQATCKGQLVLGACAAAQMAFGQPGIASAQDKEVRVWHTEVNPTSIEAIANIIERFEAKHHGIKVEAEALAWGDLEGKIMAALAAGAPPELSHRSRARRWRSRACSCR